MYEKPVFGPGGVLEEERRGGTLEMQPSGRPDGFMPFVLEGHYGRIYGGPYRNRSRDYFGVKMAAEIDASFDAKCDTKDFSVPNPHDLEAALIAGGIAALQGKDLWVGCMGGIGRTGLYMAAFAKVCGHPDPVAHVRATYKGHAVETAQQQKFIADFDVTPVQAALLGYLSLTLKRQRWGDNRWSRVLNSLRKIIKSA